MKDKFVCSIHFLDEHIEQYIFRKGTNKPCSYCANAAFCIDMVELAGYIERYLRPKYEDPIVLGMAYYPAASYEDSFPGVTVLDTQEVLYQELDLTDKEGGIIDDLCSHMKTEFWVEKY